MPFSGPHRRLLIVLDSARGHVLGGSGQRGASRGEPGVPLSRKAGADPFPQDHQAIAEHHEEQNVDEQPYRSSDEAREVPAAEIGDNPLSPNGGQGSLLDVPV